MHVYEYMYKYSLLKAHTLENLNGCLGAVAVRYWLQSHNDKS